MSRNDNSRNNRPIQQVNGREIRPLSNQWAYHSNMGYLEPRYWSKTHPECGNHSQSPIDVPFAGDFKSLTDLTPSTTVTGCLNYEWHHDHQHTDLKWSIQSQPLDNCVAIGSVENKEFSLLQFHLHSPSEHRIGGKSYDAEIHFVHVSDDGKRLMVIGIVMNAKEGAIDSPFIKELLDSVAETGKVGNTTMTESYGSFIDISSKKWFNYQGSLTTPPCSEIVDWWLSPQVVDISIAQLQAIRSRQKLMTRNADSKNNRPVQPLNGREVKPLSNQWAYHGSNAFLEPKFWGVQHPECAKHSQSPIDVPFSGVFSALASIKPAVTQSGCSVYEWHADPQHTDLKWSLNSKVGDSCKAVGSVAELTFDLLQLHMHSPSEHKINGKSFDGEVHFVHISPDGEKLMVIGILLTTALDNTIDNPMVAELLAGLGTTKKHGIVTIAGEYSDFIAADTKKWFNYQGSLTTPPCSEIVDWWLSPEPVTISVAQLNAIQTRQGQSERTAFSANNRPIQPLNGRQVKPMKNEWSYHGKDGSTGPTFWKRNFQECGDNQQSPINIPFTQSISSMLAIAPTIQVTGCSNFQYHVDATHTDLKWSLESNSGDSCEALGNTVTPGPKTVQAAVTPANIPAPASDGHRKLSESAPEPSPASEPAPEPSPASEPAPEPSPASEPAPLLEQDLATMTALTAGHEGVYFELLQFHMHSPSEHQINDKTYDAELHFVHKAKNNGGSLLVVGLLMTASGEVDNPFIADLLAPLEMGGTGSIVLSKPYQDFINASGRKWFNYKGSLTTPPCSEIVDWWISPETIAISNKQLNIIQSYQRSMARNVDAQNNRPVNPLNGRRIKPFMLGNVAFSHWAYHSDGGFIGPDSWSTEYAECAKDSNSPIDFDFDEKVTELKKINPIFGDTAECTNFNWHVDLSHTDLKWTLIAPKSVAAPTTRRLKSRFLSTTPAAAPISGDSGDAACNAIGVVANERFALLQLHMHSPSEHTLNGVKSDGEIHFVHQNAATGKLLVVGLLLDGSGTVDHPFVTELLAPMAGTGTHGHLTLTKSYADFLNVDSKKWFNYQGSLTTPPCSEIVDWWVSPEPMAISIAQLKTIRDKQMLMPRTLKSDNSRPTQLVNARKIRPLDDDDDDDDSTILIVIIIVAAVLVVIGIIIFVLTFLKSKKYKVAVAAGGK